MLKADCLTDDSQFTGGVMTRLLCQLLSTAVFLLASLSSVLAQDGFYKGKTIRIIVGAAAGGGYDTYSRTIARHFGKHIPGNPDHRRR
jgi:tripartite-type tricarboxylate transporter receptor subunit TctC